MTAFRLELRRNRALTIWLAVALGGYAAIMGLMYPFMKANEALVQQYMDAFPKEFMAAFGMTGSLSDPGVFFTTYISSWLWPIIAAAAGLLTGTRAVAADLDRGFLDLPLSTGISRIRYLWASIAGQLLLVAILALIGVVGLWVAGIMVGAEFDLGRFLLAGVLCFAFGCAIAGPTTLLSVMSLSRGLAAGIVGGVLILMYALFVVSQVSSDWSWLGPLSAWNHFPTTTLIDDGVFPLGDVALFALIAIGTWVAALWAFRRRDLAA